MLVKKPSDGIHGMLSMQSNAGPSILTSQTIHVITNDAITLPRTEPVARNVFM